MRLDLMTSPEIEAYRRRTPGVIVPVGSLEQHGAQGLLGTDALAAEAVAREVGARTGAAVAPTLAYAPAQFNLGFAGTVSLRPSTMTALVVDLIVSFGRGGFGRLLFVNGHGANTAPIHVAIQEVMSEVSVGRLAFPRPVTAKLRAWWEGPRVQQLRRDLYGDREGFHVTPSEVAIVAALHPERAPSPAGWPPFQPLPDDPLLEHGGDRHEDADRHARRYPTGIVGSDPALVLPGHGETLLNAAAADLAELWHGFIAAPDPAGQSGR